MERKKTLRFIAFALAMVFVLALAPGVAMAVKPENVTDMNIFADIQWTEPGPNEDGITEIYLGLRAIVYAIVDPPGTIPVPGVFEDGMKMEWSSSDPNRVPVVPAPVEGQSNIRGMALTPSPVTITGILKDASGKMIGKPSTMKVLVVPPPTLKSVTLSNVVTEMEAGDTAEVDFAFDPIIYGSLWDPVIGLAFESSNPGVASCERKVSPYIYNKIIVNAKSAGEATIFMKLKGKTYASFTVTVTAKAPKKVELNKTAVTLKPRKSVQLKAEVQPDGAAQDVKWKSSKPGVAKVSRTGKVTAVKKGKAVITATAEGSKKKASCTVYVDGIAVQKAKMNKTALTLRKGAKQTLKVKVTPADAAYKKVVWASSKPDVATVSKKGVVKALKKGWTIVTATTLEGGKKAKCKVTVR